MNDTKILSTSPVRNLRITLIQADTHWHQPDKNRTMFEDLIRPLKGQTELVVLPEMFTSGYTLEPENAQDTGSQTTDWLLNLAEECKCAITGSLAYQHSEGVYSNRMLFARPDGSLEHYDKVHMFRMADEHKRYLPGKARVVVNFLDWRILLTVCYDLRFPVFCRNQVSTTELGYDLMLCVANWPEPRRQPWRQLLQARAVENLAYVAGVNRVGTDGKGWQYSGDSMLVDYQGQVLIDHEPDQTFVETYRLDARSLSDFRTRFPAWLDADEFELKIGTRQAKSGRAERSA